MPNISLSEDQDDINQVIEGKKDLAYQMTFEVVPEIALADFGSIELERLSADVDDETLQKSIDDLLKRAGSFEPDAERKAETGDRVTITYAGTINGEAFEGGTGEGLALVLGNAGFIPGFEEGIVGMARMRRRMSRAASPTIFGRDARGQGRVFKVTVTLVEKPVEAKLDDEMAKAFGAENAENLKDLVRKQIQGEFDKAARV